MFLAPLRLLVSPIAIAIINVIILVPMVLSIVDIVQGLRHQHDFKEPVEIVTTVAVMMIGWGVALEERHMLREVFGMLGRADEAWQGDIDQLCHRVGVGVLVLGLFADICVEMISLPDRIINTSGVELELVIGALLLIAAGSAILVRHIFRLVSAVLGR